MPYVTGFPSHPMSKAEVEEKARWVLEQQVTPATALSLVGQVWGEDLSQ